MPEANEDPPKPPGAVIWSPWSCRPYRPWSRSDDDDDITPAMRPPGAVTCSLSSGRIPGSCQAGSGSWLPLLRHGGAAEAEAAGTDTEAAAEGSPLRSCSAAAPASYDGRCCAAASFRPLIALHKSFVSVAQPSISFRINSWQLLTDLCTVSMRPITLCWVEPLLVSCACFWRLKSSWTSSWFFILATLSTATCSKMALSAASLALRDDSASSRTACTDFATACKSLLLEAASASTRLVKPTNCSCSGALPASRTARSFSISSCSASCTASRNERSSLNLASTCSLSLLIASA
mmetsp:Transcript_41383/g.109136  ORF Transcript_41383/g.109136 Transcript_41383/m.109136 type:complete len:293 (+) Transcript_41383:394-1272(+)